MQATNAQLLSMSREIQQMNSSVLGFFLRSKIQQFYSDNGIRIESIQNKIRKLQEEYFIIENEKVKLEGEGKDAKPVLQEGKDKKDFDVLFEKLMNEEVTVKI